VLRREGEHRVEGRRRAERRSENSGRGGRPVEQIVVQVEREEVWRRRRGRGQVRGWRAEGDVRLRDVGCLAAVTGVAIVMAVLGELERGTKAVAVAS